MLRSTLFAIAAFALSVVAMPVIPAADVVVARAPKVTTVAGVVIEREDAAPERRDNLRYWSNPPNTTSERGVDAERRQIRDWSIPTKTVSSRGLSAVRRQLRYWSNPTNTTESRGLSESLNTVRKRAVAWVLAAVEARSDSAELEKREPSLIQPPVIQVAEDRRADVNVD